MKTIKNKKEKVIFKGSDLMEADLREANLRGADLREANLREADLWRADLWGADLRGADLRGANLRGANLREADLWRADLENTKLPPLSILPEGNIIGWKNVRGKLIKLLIPAEAKRVNSTGRKCRAEYAKVLEGGPAKSKYDYGKIIYEKGKTVYPDSFDPDFRKECSHGIHFFITKKEAEEWG